jgi:hypothetical protein
MAADVAVIWSLVWAGRMRNNRSVWQHYRNSNRPVIVLEVGTLARGQTWKMGVNGLGSDAIWGQDRDPRRPQKLGLATRPWQPPGSDVVVVLQRGDSEQWVSQPPSAQWLDILVRALREYTDRRIRIRQHPRSMIPIPPGCELDQPQRQIDTYDDYDLDTSLARAWAVINVNSGAGVNAVIRGVPLFCHESSLAAPVSELDWSKIEYPRRPDRDQWFVDLCHTEWTTAEISTGAPLARLLPCLESL